MGVLPSASYTVPDMEPVEESRAVTRPEMVSLRASWQNRENGTIRRNRKNKICFAVLIK
jgi:hypothetical protein